MKTGDRTTIIKRAILISNVFFTARAYELFGMLIKLRNLPSAISVLTALERFGLEEADLSLNVTPRSSHDVKISRTFVASVFSFK